MKSKNTQKIRKYRNMSMSNKLFYLFNTIFWILVMFIVIYPLYFVIIASFSDPNAVYLGNVRWFPVDFSLIGYEHIFKNKELWNGYANSIINTFSATVVALLVTMPAGYVMSRKPFFGKGFLSWYFVATMFFGGGLIPTFLWVKDLGLYNTRLALIVMGCFGVWNMMLARVYIQTTIPEELYEAAVLDGATHLQYITKVVVPLSKTIMAVLAVYYSVGEWNDYFSALIYIQDPKLLPLQTVLQRSLAQATPKRDEELEQMLYENLIGQMEAERLANVAKYCIMVVGAAPVVILYVAVQRFFEKGIMIGSLKG